MKNVFENFNVTDSMNEQLKQLTSLQSGAFEPARVFAAVAADAVEQIARKNYAVVGDVVEFSTRQVHLPLSSDNLTDVSSAQMDETNAFVELMNSRASEYSEIAQQLSNKVKETSESVASSFN